MTDKNRLTVKIFGNDYKLVSDDPKSYMKNVAYYVDERMNEIANNNKKFSSSMVAVLTALNIADDHFRLKEAFDALRSKVSNSADAAVEYQGAQSIDVETEKKTQEFEAISKEFKRVLDHAAHYQSEVEDLKDKLRLLSYELQSKAHALDDSNNRIAELESELKAIRD
ncbi:MAG: hypothetical protein CSA13_00330 [Clostridiales bacterium]|nr:MAG: hypothetical protein CSB19_00360 [Clostridiales bacterium]PIE77249.1 MAG: hypothetical protein CSA13_00330 [Clostridiales bacterium]